MPGQNNLALVALHRGTNLRLYPIDGEEGEYMYILYIHMYTMYNVVSWFELDMYMYMS